MREFRSELPSLIHRRGIDVEPVTLEVGANLCLYIKCLRAYSQGERVTLASVGLPWLSHISSFLPFLFSVYKAARVPVRQVNFSPRKHSM